MTPVGTEVRSITSGGQGLGLFATKDFQVGDVIVQESEVLVKLFGLTSDEEQELISAFAGKSCNPTDNIAAAATTFRETIHDIPEGIKARDHEKFRGMVHVGARYLLTSNQWGEFYGKLFELYHPSLTNPSQEEDDALQLARMAAQYLKDHKTSTVELPHSLEDDPTVQQTLQVMLIWSCNAFEGGRIYHTLSRINHSCNPNAIVQANSTTGSLKSGTDDNIQVIRAAAAIPAGEEITISYLGTLLYGASSLRRSELLHHKFFTCHCDRCTRTPDLAASIPCVACHPRTQHKLQLDEDVQYDDDHAVHYMYPESGPSTRYMCPSCHQSFDASDPQNDKHKIRSVVDSAQSISNRVAQYLQTQAAATPQTKVLPGATSTAATVGNTSNNEADDSEDDGDNLILEEHLTLASSVLGAKHWTTNLLLLLQLDQTLQQYHANLIRTSAAKDDGDNDNDNMEVIASCIDMLERLFRFVDGLQLQYHRGHVLSQVTIGVARALVSFGDVKSQRYAKEWLDKLDSNDSYVPYFESEGLQKVVATLKQAHLQSTKNEDDAGGCPPAKRVKN